MSRRGVILLAVATVLVSVAAIWASLHNERTTEARFRPGPLFPTLAERAPAVAQIDVTTRNTAVRVKRDGPGWVVASKDDYPAKPDLVRRTIFALINAKATERATALPENHQRVGLIAPDQGGSATRVLLLDEAGSQLAALLIGDPVPSDAPVDDTQSYFVRKVGDNQVWIAEGDLPVESDVRAWLYPDIAYIDRARIQSTTVVFPDGSTYAVARKAPDQPDFVIRAVPDGREPAPVMDVANALGRAPSALSFDNVRARAKVGFPDQAEHVVYRTFDGLVLDIALAKLDDGATWATFAASLDDTIIPPSALPGAAPAQPAAPDAPRQDAAKTDAGPAEVARPAAPAAPTAAAIAPKPPLEAPDVVAKEKEAINSRAQGWVYRLPAALAADLSHPVEDLLAPVAAPAAAKAKSEPAEKSRAKPKPSKKSQKRPKSRKAPAKASKPASAVSAPAH